MKGVVSTLILLIAIHAQCGIWCRSTDADAALQKQVPSEQPPCHQHTHQSPDEPSDHRSSGHEPDEGNSCEQAQTIGVKNVVWVSSDWVAVEFNPNPVFHLIQIMDAAAGSGSSQNTPALVLKTTPAILRI